MLKEEELDGVFIVGPPQMQCEISKRCLEEGLHVFVEKPSGVDVNAAKELADMAREKKRFGMVGFMKRFVPTYRLAKKIAEKEDFGRTKVIEIRFACGPYPPIWGIESSALSFIVGNAIHVFDLCRYFGGEVKEIYANYAESSREKFGFAVNLLFGNGNVAVLNLNSMQSWHDFNEHFCLTGDEKWITIDDMLYLKYCFKNGWTTGSEDEDIGVQSQDLRPNGRSTLKTEMLLGYRREIEHFAKSIIKGTPPMVNLEDGVEALKIAYGIWESVGSKKVIKL